MVGCRPLPNVSCTTSELAFRTMKPENDATGLASDESTPGIAGSHEPARKRRANLRTDLVVSRRLKKTGSRPDCHSRRYPPVTGKCRHQEDDDVRIRASQRVYRCQDVVVTQLNIQQDDIGLRCPEGHHRASTRSSLGSHHHFFVLLDHGAKALPHERVSIND